MRAVGMRIFLRLASPARKMIGADDEDAAKLAVRSSKPAGADGRKAADVFENSCNDHMIARLPWEASGFCSG